MSNINVIIVDDELSARQNLSYLIANFCPKVTVVDSCKNVDDAVLSIKKHKPQLVFLDIEMPQKNGFQLLKAFDNIDFEIVFITAYDQYAIKAFEISAIDYLLKPIDVERLVNAIDKVKNQLNWTHFQSRVDVFSSNQRKLSKISIPYKSDFIIVDVDKLSCIEADRMYSHIYMLDGKKFTVSKKLSYYQGVFAETINFQRVHRSWIANLNHIASYSKSFSHILIADKEIPVSITYREKVKLIFGK